MATFKSYLIGFGLSVILTLTAFFTVTKHYPNALVLILVLAIIQFCVQIIFFLHLNEGEDKGFNLTVFFSTVFIMLILIVGTIWIMNHLNYSMSEQQINDYLLKNEGIKK